MFPVISDGPETEQFVCRLATRMQANIVQEYQRVELSPGGPKTRDRRSVSRRKKQKIKIPPAAKPEVLAPKRVSGTCPRHVQSLYRISERALGLELKSPVQVVSPGNRRVPQAEPNRQDGRPGEAFAAAAPDASWPPPGVLPPFRRLHGTHDVTMFSHVFRPPREAERRDRMSGRSPEWRVPQYWHW